MRHLVGLLQADPWRLALSRAARACARARVPGRARGVAQDRAASRRAAPLPPADLWLAEAPGPAAACRPCPLRPPVDRRWAAAKRTPQAAGDRRAPAPSPRKSQRRAALSRLPDRRRPARARRAARCARPRRRYPQPPRRDRHRAARQRLCGRARRARGEAPCRCALHRQCRRPLRRRGRRPEQHRASAPAVCGSMRGSHIVLRMPEPVEADAYTLQDAGRPRDLRAAVARPALPHRRHHRGARKGRSRRGGLLGRGAGLSARCL